MLDEPDWATLGDEVLVRMWSRLSCPWMLGDEGDGAPEPIASPITTFGGVVIGALLCAKSPIEECTLRIGNLN